MSKSWKWSALATCLKNKSIDQIIELCQFSGFSGIEVHPDFSDGKDKNELQSLRERFVDSGLRIESMHLSMEPADDAANLYETMRLKAVERHKADITKAALLGCRVVILHPTTCRFSVVIEGIDRLVDALARTMEGLLAHAESCGVKIALENMLPGADGDRLGSKPAHFALFAERFAHPMLAFCLDTGHAQVSYAPNGGALAFMDVMGEKLQAFHIQDNAGARDLHLAPGRGLVNWRGVFARMKQMGFTDAACIETPPFAYGPHDSHSLEAWRDMVRDCDNLVP